MIHAFAEIKHIFLYTKQFYCKEKKNYIVTKIVNFVMMMFVK